MSNGDLFYICGIALAVSAVLISFIGLKVKSFPGKAFPLVILWFAVLIGATATFSVLHAQDEERHKEAELEHAGEKFEAEGNDDAAGEAAAEGEAAAPGGAQPQGGAEPKSETASGPGGTIPLAADVSDLAYDKASISSKPGKVTIDFTNPSALEHDVAIEGDGEEIAASEVISESETSVSTDLAAGAYTFFCTVPGHREAGMEGQLTVK
ncbi:MAG TPA: plastocyanin/azurin family copper-binding protein [Solirubrobacterales bacterium]|nr:plastocyanin/azurin family copper-binding protein [Solirubrobacterales bacterium]